MRTAFRRHFTPSGDRPYSPLVLLLLFLVGVLGCGSEGKGPPNTEVVAQGKQTFRFDTFGDETKWTDALRMNEAISTVDPTTALKVGLKEDSETLPAEVVTGNQNGSISLTNPTNKIAQLKLDPEHGTNGTVMPVPGKD